jgi:hypothetical protein
MASANALQLLDNLIEEVKALSTQAAVSGELVSHLLLAHLILMLTSLRFCILVHLLCQWYAMDMVGMVGWYGMV